MDLTRRDEYKQKLYELTPIDGRAIGNGALREVLRAAVPADQFSEEDYWDLRNSLITDGRLEKGRGKGGSVRRVIAIESPATAALADASSQFVSAAEASLYEPFQKAIQNGYVPDNDLKPWVCEITASQGRRNTGGVWTRPDVTLIAMQTFTYTPDKIFQVVTFEIKPSVETALAGVYEAAAHSAFAHRSFLAFPAFKDYDRNPTFERIRQECLRFNLGLILFEDVAVWDTYEFELDELSSQPEPHRVNDFIKGQISEKNREEIQRWFR